MIAAWKAARPSATGNVSRYSMRAIVDAIQYQNRAGCPWSLMPNDLPPPWTVKYFFYQWRDDGLDQTLCELLRCRVRERVGRTENPSLVVLDAQSVHAANNIPAATTGKDAAKRVPGRKHGLAVDIIGLIIAVVVVAASVHDNQVGTALLSRVAATTGSVRTALVDQGFKNSVIDHGAGLGIDGQIAPRNPEPGFTPQPIRWRVEQTYGTLILQRRLTRDHEGNPRTTESWLYWAASTIMLRRLTGTAAPSRRGP